MNNKHQIPILATCLLLSIGCGNAGNTVVAEQAQSDTTISTAADKNKETTCGISMVKEFLLWYKGKRSNLNTIQLVSLTGDSATAQYRVNNSHTAAYINDLKGSGLLSPLYLQYLQHYFKTADDRLLASRQNDGPPEGLDFDLVLFTQEPESMLEQPDKWRFEQVNANTVAFIHNSGRLLFTLDKTSGACLIAGIKPDGPL